MLFFCKVNSQFCTPYCTNLRQYSTRLKRGGAHDNAQIPNLQLHSSVAVATCRKTFFPQFVLLQYKAKPYLAFQNLRCHHKILGCHFDTHKRLKKTLASTLTWKYELKPGSTSVCGVKVTEPWATFNTPDISFRLAPQPSLPIHTNSPITSARSTAWNKNNSRNLFLVFCLKKLTSVQDFFKS